MGGLILGPIVGGLSHSGAYLWGRCEAPGVLHAWLGRTPDLADATLAGVSLPLRPDDGFAGVAVVKGLPPGTHFHYALTLDSAHPPPGIYPGFTTLPLPTRREDFSFAFGSCFRPENANGGGIFNAIEALRLQSQDDPANALRFMLHIGDQIYSDDYTHNSLGRIACSVEDYRTVYAYTWSRPPLRRLFENLPAYMTLDDHEVDDDWRWTTSDRQSARIPWWDAVVRLVKRRPRSECSLDRQRVLNALQAYWEHQGMHSPGFELPPRVDSGGQYSLAPQDPGSLAYTFTCGTAAFYVLDTRSMRVRGSAGRSMLGEGQWRALEDWLNTVRDVYPVKFIVTSCALLYRLFMDIPQDRWSGYAAERNRLLGFIAEKGIENVYLLAGDLHAAHAVRASLYGPNGKDLDLWEFCSTPFEQKPNKISRFLYNPRPFGPVRQLERKFAFGALNFGVVRVRYDAAGQPRVRFEVRGAKGELLGETGNN